MSSFIKFIKLIFRFIRFIFNLLFSLFSHKKRNKKSQEPEPVHESASSLPEAVQEQKAIHEEDSKEQKTKPEAEMQSEPEHDEFQETESETTQKKEPIHESESSLPEVVQEQEVIHEEDSQEQETEPELDDIQEAEPEATQEHETEHEPEHETEDVQTEPEAEPDIRTETEDEAYKQKIRNIITQHYCYYGFAIQDTEGYKRFRTYAKNYEIELPPSDNELRKLIISSGTLIDGNVYVFSHDDVHRMLCGVQRLIDDGVSVVYFRELESFIEDSNLYHNLSCRRAVREILRDNYNGYIFTDLYMETPEHKTFRSYMDGLKYVLAKYFPEGFNSDYALLREYASKENIILSGNDKALKRETDALKERL